jgi:hypothetical protein
MPPGERGRRWFLTHTQMANEPTYVDRGERTSRQTVYCLGGPEAMAQQAETRTRSSGSSGLATTVRIRTR